MVLNSKDFQFKIGEMSHFIPHFGDTAIDVMPWLMVCSGMLGMLLGLSYVLLLIVNEYRMSVHGENRVGLEIRRRRKNAEWNQCVVEYCTIHGLAVPTVTIAGNNCSENGV